MRGLVTAFDTIRTTYFPRWDKNREWTIVVKDIEPRVMIARCDTQNKEICIDPSFVPDSDAHLFALIVHEICHPVACHYHGKRFQARLMKAAGKADDMGETELASRVRADAELCQQPARPSHARFVYNDIQDAVFDNPNAPMDKLLTAVAYRHGETLEYFLKRYRRAKMVFREAQKLSKSMQNGEQTVGQIPNTTN